jgi:hypothetical protein
VRESKAVHLLYGNLVEQIIYGIAGGIADNGLQNGFIGFGALAYQKADRSKFDESMVEIR